jgi:hypothetical protein
MTCLLPYWRSSGSERNIVAPWGWHCFAETRRSHRKKIKMCIIQCILLVILYIPNVMFRGPQYLLALKVKCMSRMQTITLNLTAQVKRRQCNMEGYNWTRNYSLLIFIILRRWWEFQRFFSDCSCNYQHNFSLDTWSRLLSHPYTKSVLSHPHSSFDYLKSATKIRSVNTPKHQKSSRRYTNLHVIVRKW